ncbi:MAG: 3',5'-cyclic adenosine monophosphate phosphodiesterase CpdA [Ignavibacteriaceae bacterium]|nr:3',5'-cyclic adenosine monophosphate phosphodiesterase CpdA [Ignavibacteriaceae bacterium]
MASRRDFLKYSLLGSAAAFLPSDVFARLRPLSETEGRIRIRGKVSSGALPVKGAVVSDGFQTAVTSSDGTYELVTSSDARFVHCSVPSGYILPVNEKGIAQHYRRITPRSNGEFTASFDLAKNPADDRNHVFFALGDTQMLDKQDMERFHKESVPDIAASVKKYAGMGMFGVTVGDIVFDKPDLYPDYIEGVAGTGLPFLQVLGNHDVVPGSKSDEMSAAGFEEKFGPAYYSFNRGEVHYVVLDDVFWFSGYIGYIPDHQLRWLQRDLQHVEKGSRVVIFTHIPVYCRQHERNDKKSPSNSLVVTNREMLYRILEPYKTTIICGHTHESEYIQDGGCSIDIVGAVCGAWWTSDICGDGTPNGYAVYEVNGSTLNRRYKGTGKPDGYQMEAMVYSRDGRKYLAANVWAADSGWEVSLYKGADSLGLMTRELAKDSRAVDLFDGDGMPAKHPWVGAYMTDHLFVKEITGEKGTYTVEALEPSGKKHVLNYEV